jgi:ATP-dependent helicase/nuclease subunit A
VTGGTSGLADAAARERIATDLNTSLICLAGAGAGKTHALVQRMVACVREGVVDIGSMAAITFTRKAAGEMRGRFFLALQAAADAAANDGSAEAVRRERRLREALSRVDQCAIGTIHAYCARLLRERPVEAGLPPDFAEVEEREELMLGRAAWDDFLQARAAAGDERLLAVEDTGLTAEQFYQFYLDRCQFSDLMLKPTVAERPDLEPAVTQVCDLVREIDARVPDVLPEGRPDDLMTTVRSLRHFVDFTGPPSDADRERILRDMSSSRATGIVFKRWGPPGSPEQSFARRLKKDVLPDLQAGVIKPLLARWGRYVYTLAGALVDEAMVFYRDRRLAAATLTFNDLLEQTARVLRERPDVRQHLRRRTGCLFVDEFQDTDPLQAQILLQLTARESDETDWRRLTPRPGSLFLVGDEKQSIYRFRRADLDVFRLARDRVLAGGGAVVELTTCFRGRPAVIDWINQAFEPLFDNHDGRYQAPFQRLARSRERQRGAGVYRLQARSDAGRREELARDEAGRIAAFIDGALAGRTELNGEGAVLGRVAGPGDFLILTRTRRYLSEYARALEERGIPYDVTGAGSLRESVELKSLVDVLDSLRFSDDPVPFVAVLRGLLVGLGDDELYALRRAGWSFRWWADVPNSDDLDEATVRRVGSAQARLRTLQDDLQTRPPAAALERFVESSGLAAWAAAGEAGSSRAGNLTRILSIVRDAQSRRRLTWSEAAVELGEILQEQRQRVEEMTLETGRDDVVRVMNLHQAKGLEAKVVFLADPLDTSGRQHTADVHVSRLGDQPYLSMAVTRRVGFGSVVVAEPEGWEADAAEEERFLAAEALRLVYVAATRARDVLVVGTTGQSKGAWSDLEAGLSDVEALPMPSAPAPPRRTAQDPLDVAALQRRIAEAHAAVREPGYRLEAVTEDEHDDLWTAETQTRGRGRRYGIAVHRLIESAVQGRLDGLDEDGLAAWVGLLLREEGIEQEAQAQAARRALDAFRASSLWQELRREGASAQAEVPFADGDGQHVRRGVIDLIYRVDGGWKIVDVKTHADLTQDLTQHYARQVEAYAAHWEAVSGEAVVERGLWLATSDGTDRYVCLSPG